MKNQQIGVGVGGRGVLKKGELGQFADLKGDLVKKRGVFLSWGWHSNSWYPNAHKDTYVAHVKVEGDW